MGGAPETRSIAGSRGPPGVAREHGLDSVEQATGADAKTSRGRGGGAQDLLHERDMDAGVGHRALSADHTEGSDASLVVVGGKTRVEEDQEG